LTLFLVIALLPGFSTPPNLYGLNPPEVSVADKQTSHSCQYAKTKTLEASSANVPSAVVNCTRTECRFILIACLPMASALPIDSAADRRSGDFGKSPFCEQLSARAKSLNFSLRSS
jgi:hypothetical protein